MVAGNITSYAYKLLIKQKTYIFVAFNNMFGSESKQFI